MILNSFNYELLFKANLSSLSETLTRRKHIVHIIFFSMLVLFLIHLYFSSFATGYPLSMEHAKYYGRQDINLRTVEASHVQLYELINSAANKAVFSQLQYSENAYYDLGNNVVGNAEFPVYNQFQRQPYVANGYLGSRIPNIGQGFTYDQLTDASTASDDDLLNGWPLFNKRYSGAFVAGFFDIQNNVTETNYPELYANGYESIIAAIPQWTSLTLSTEHNGNIYSLNPALNLSGQISNYQQNMSLSNGIVSTEFTWLDSLQIKFDVLAHRQEVRLGLVNLEVSNLSNDTFTIDIEDVLDFATAQRSQLTGVDSDSSGIYMTFQPHQLDYINGAIYSKLIASTSPAVSSNETSISQSLQIQLSPGESTTLAKVVGVATTDYDPSTASSQQDVLNMAKNVANSHSNITDIFTSHKVAWAQTLEATPAVTFPDDLLLTLTTRASIYHLTANTQPNNHGVTAALGVGGLSSDSYAGMVFWDADIWMMNGLLPYIPAHAKSITNYRLHTHEQAIKNVPQGYEGAVYPWTSGRFGNCTSTGPCLDYEYHINTAVALSAWDVYLSGAGDEEYLKNVVYPLVNDAASFFSTYLTRYNSTLQQYTTHNLTDPDEYANQVDNGAYTNAGISSIMRKAIAVANHLDYEFASNFSSIAGNMFIPNSGLPGNITLEYSGMNSSVGIKQADVIMMTYPLNDEEVDVDQALRNMEFYSLKQVSYGPAMTFPIFSIVSSKLARHGCAAQSYLQKSVRPYLRGPFAQFSEQNNDNFLTNGGTHPAFPFLTAHGGFLQAILQGIVGLRYDYEVIDGKISRVLELDPRAMPCLPNGVMFEGIKYNNHSLSFTIHEDRFSITNDGPLPSNINSNSNDNTNSSVKIKLASRNLKAGTYTLATGQQLVFPLYTPQSSFPSSISECGAARFVNITQSAYGDAPSSMNDGDNTTHWQSFSNSSTGKVLIDLKQFKNISSMLVNWGDKPAQHLTVSTTTTDSTTAKLETVFDFLSSVDFGNNLYDHYQYGTVQTQVIPQSQVFASIFSDYIDISAPYDAQEATQIDIPSHQNVTTVQFTEPVYSRFLLLEMDGIHDESPIDGDTGGAKLFEVVLF
ncbi:vacuolar acid trehalase [Scheffersomyces amazonensis]|uniref:vacuolar acid trehalase n=1 Tax=Scheffersomyces amazonensis TaxID=1078765 RepID=UPI00315DFCF4